MVSPVLGLSAEGIVGKLRLWQVITYSLLHHTPNPLQLLLATALVWMLCGELEKARGVVHSVCLFFAGAVGAGVFHIVVAPGCGPALGSSGGLYALLFGIAHQFPSTPISQNSRLSIRFVCLLTALVLFAVCFWFTSPASEVVHYTQLSGAIFGWLFVRYEPRLRFLFYRAKKEAKRRRRVRRQLTSARVDQLLEKVGRFGVQRLSWRERFFLKRVSRKLRRD